MLTDDLVNVKTAFHHSINKRSVIFFAKGQILETQDEKYQSFKPLTNKMMSGSWDYLKPVSKKKGLLNYRNSFLDR